MRELPAWINENLPNVFVMLLWVCIHTGQAEKFAW
jgi:hypothetical protein